MDQALKVIWFAGGAAEPDTSADGSRDPSFSAFLVARGDRRY